MLFRKSFIVFIAVNVLLSIVNAGFGNFAFAEERTPLSNLRISGYGTLSYIFDDCSTMAPARDISQKPDESYKTGSTWVHDSRLGLQADYRISPQIEFVVQGVLRDHVEIDLDNSIESAFAGFRPYTHLDLRAGRLGYDAFLMSDTRNLGYSYSWIRPPIEFYGWIPIFSVNGIDAAYTIDEGEAQWRIKAQAGISSLAIPMDEEIFDFKTNNLFSLTISRQSGPLRIKTGYSQFTCNSEARVLLPLHAGLGAVAAGTAGLFPEISAEADDLQDDLSFKDARIGYMTIGASYDDGKWVAQAEIGHTTATADIIPNGTMGYLGVGYRFGDWTPYFIVSAIRPGDDVRKASSDWSLIGQAALQNQSLAVVNSTRMEQNTESLGIRWDFHNQAALKLQWDCTRVKSSGYGLWWRSPGTNSHDKTVNMLTASMEFVL